jgi:hypothetical protein
VKRVEVKRVEVKRVEVKRVEVRGQNIKIYVIIKKIKERLKKYIRCRLKNK